jgi:hypothetical protein
MAALTPTPPRTSVAATAAPIPSRRPSRPRVVDAAGRSVEDVVPGVTGYCSVGWSSSCMVGSVRVVRAGRPVEDNGRTQN